MDKFEMRTKALIVHGGKVPKKGSTIFVSEKERTKYLARGWATDVEQLTRPTENPSTEVKSKRQYKRKDMTAESNAALEPAPVEPNYNVPVSVNSWSFPKTPQKPESDDGQE